MSEHPFEPVLTHDPAPDHAPGFWDQLAAEMAPPTAADGAPQNDTTGDATTKLPVASPVVLDERRARRTRTALDQRRPFAAAAAMVVLVGLLGFGAFSLFGGNGDGTTDVVAGEPDATDAAPVPATGGDESGESAESGDEAAVESVSADVAEPADVTASDTDTGAAADASAPGAADDAVEGESAPVTQEPVRVVQGAVVGSAPERGVVWTTIADRSVDCNDARYSTLSVLGDGEQTPRMASSPQRHYSGTVDAFTLSPNTDFTAWLVGCGTQLELYVAGIGRFGDLIEPRLVWLGQGSTDSALIVWDGTTVSLNVLWPGEGPVFVDHDVITGATSGSGVDRSSAAPCDLSPVPVAATPSGAPSWWSAAPGSTCVYETGQTSTLHQFNGVTNFWQPVRFSDGLELAEVTAAAHESVFDQVAIADLDGADNARIILATVRADGLFSAPIVIDLSAYVPGHAVEMLWLDETTLWFRTDNSRLSMVPVRFTLSLGDGRDDVIITQLDT